MREREHRWLWVAWATQLAFNITVWVVVVTAIFFLFQGQANVRDWWSIDTRNTEKRIIALEAKIEALKQTQEMKDERDSQRSTDPVGPGR